MAHVTIPDTAPRVQYTVGGTSTTDFTIPFAYFADSDIKVYVGSTLKTLSTDYTITGTAVDEGYSGGTVVLNTGVTSTTVTVLRDVPVKRVTDFPTNGPFNITQLNTELDSLTAQLQQEETGHDLFLRIAEYDTYTDLTLPVKADRAGTVLGFNATTGDPEAGPTIADVSTLAAITADIATLADIEDGTDATDAIQTVAGIASNVTTVAGISGNVTTVAGISANVTSVAGNATNINTVAGIDSDVTAVAAIDSNVTTVAGIAADVTAVANNEVDISQVATDIAKVVEVANDLQEAVSEIDTVANNIANVNTVGGIAANVTTVAGISGNVTTVAGISGNVTTVAGISANVTTVAGISANVTTVAGDSADIATVAGLSTEVGALGAISADITTAAANVTDITNFADVYIGASATAPTTRADTSALQVGDLYFDTSTDTMKVYSSGGWINAGSSVNGTANRYDYVVGTSSGSYTGSTTNFPATYDAGYVDVFLNGTKLVPTTDFTATSGTEIVLGTAASSGSNICIVGYGTFSLANFSVGDANDVDLSGISDGDALFYNSTSGNFEAGPVTAPTPAAVSDAANSSTGYFALPTGTTAQRPVSPANGYIRYNTTEGYIEEYRSGAWIPLSDVFAASGGTETTYTGYKVHTFTSSGTFTVLSGTKEVQALIVAGGGAGGSRLGGGGGAGGMITTSTSLSAGAYSVVVGAGGAGTVNNTGQTGGNGSNSSFNGSTAIGGGGGGSGDDNNDNAEDSGQAGGSGGGGAWTSGSGGSSTSGQGSSGGAAYLRTDSHAGGGGGGKGGAGANGTSTNGGNGGNGSTNDYQTGSNQTYAGGGGGAVINGPYTRGSGGSGGGGQGGNGGSNGDAGTANTGGGAGGGWEMSTSPAGGSGIVIIRYAA
jgi:hypothetical protein